MEINAIVLDARIQLPTLGTPGAAAYDLQAVRFFDEGKNAVPLTEALILEPGALVLVGSGIRIHIGSVPQTSLAALILPRSGKGSNGLVIGNLVGLIDSDYQGELIMSLWNRTLDQTFVIEPLERVAQLVFVPVFTPTLRQVNDFSSVTTRGSGGFGSTDLTKLSPPIL